MIPMRLSEIAEVVGGTVDGAGETVVTGAAFHDSRAPQPGGLFVALVGERVDGHDFVDAAVAAGAVAVLGSRPTTAPTVVVPDPQAALGKLARHVLGDLTATVVAVTGSQGKTGTKDLVAQVLARVGTVVATEGSENNELGLPLTVLRATPATEYVVLEMGARGVGHLTYLCRIAPPNVSVVLNVGKAHVGEFGSVAAIAQAKGELVEALPDSGVAVLNADDPLVAAMAARTSARVLTFGEGSADVRIEGLTTDALGRPSFDLATSANRAPVSMRLVGEHQALNAAAAATVALALGIPLDVAAGALSHAGAASRWRMELRERRDGVVVINDAYNANPDSMRAALTTLSGIGRARRGGRTIAVLGEMRELGASSPAEHAGVGTLAVQLGIDRLVVVGEPARPLHEAAGLAGSANGASVFVSDGAGALAWLRDHLAPGDVVLVKASRAAALERVAEALFDDENDDPDRTDEEAEA